jgi:hypothetical protein
MKTRIASLLLVFLMSLGLFLSSCSYNHADSESTTTNQISAEDGNTGTKDNTNQGDPSDTNSRVTPVEV